MVSHDPAVAKGAQRVLRIREGRVVEDQGALVVGSGGWLRLDEGLLATGGISQRVRAKPASEGLLLTPAGDSVGQARGAASGPPLGPPASRFPLASSVSLRADEPACVTLRSVSRTIGAGGTRTRIIDELTLEFAPGRLTLVTGPSGAGKTSLLELIGLLAPPSSGELTIDGEEVGSLDGQQRAALRRARIGYLAQEPVPVGFLSAEENVALALRIRGRTAGEAMMRAREALVEVGLAQRCGQRVAHLSAGESQRVALARALVCADGLLLVDEPTSRLDEGNAAAVGELLRRAAGSGGQTVICATHDPQLTRHADEIVALGSRHG